MCGIAGFIPFKSIKKDELESKASLLHEPIMHRGPDDHGVFISDDKKLVLTHRRLSIVDLSPTGHQPMTSPSGRYVVVYNGEIYNFQILKQQLEALNYKFKGTSDTEVALAAFEEWGVKGALSKIEGMFAFALYDRKENLLYLIRDRMGKKPLYYGYGSDGFYFASELKSICSALPEKPVINKDAASLYFQWRYVPDPHCIYQDFYKLSPGHILKIPMRRDKDLKSQPYWSLKSTLDEIKPFEGTEGDALDILDTFLTKATQQRMISDVPLGAFLSGGIDSSLVVAMMQKHAKVKTFTISFEDKKYNEAESARQIANHLGTDHAEAMLTGREALDTMDCLADIYDEPFGDPSAIPTYHVCRLARKTMTVALSGDGGDESFGGYSWYERSRKVDQIPAPLRYMIGSAAASLPLPPQYLKMAHILKSSAGSERYKALHSYSHLYNLIKGKHKSLPLPNDAMNENLMAHDSVMFLPGDVLTKVDRASMVHSLEVRAPLLDREVIEFAWSLPSHMRRKKILLKRLLARYVPYELIDRPKQGFSIPHGQWLAGPLQEWAEDLLSEQMLEQSNLFNTRKVRAIWKQHKSGSGNYAHLLWTITQFQNWYRRWG